MKRTKKVMTDLQNKQLRIISENAIKKQRKMDEYLDSATATSTRFEMRTGIQQKNSKQEDLKDVDKYFSIVIPTMWKSDKIFKMLSIYEKFEYVKEIIIIDNNPQAKTIDLTEYKKVKYYTKGENIYVNPAWNWGYSLSNHNLILANDDIIIDNFDNVMKLISSSDYDIIGIGIPRVIYSDEYQNDNDENVKIYSINEFPKMGYGYFMFIKKYIYIPDQLKIWYGDKILFDANKKRGIIKNANISFDKGKTINSNNSLLRENIAKKDIEIYESLTKTSNSLNIIIRTSRRPLFFEKCINSIRKNYSNAKLYITIDDIKDLEYVKKYARDFDYNYYLIDKEIIKNICEKISIEKSSFIYNYYFNVVKPYLNGWCLFLDDDDELLIKPEFNENNIKNIYLYKIDIGIKIVPSVNNFGNFPIINDISGLGIIFHSSQMVDWKPQRTGDYSFISEMYQNNNSIWIDKILSKTQVGGNFGKRNDLNEFYKTR